MKNQMLTARLPPEILYGIDEFQKKQNLSFRTDALIEIVKVACSAVGIDLSNIPAAPASPVETHEEDEVPGRWKCPFTERVGEYERCEERSKEHREECKACKAVPKYYREILFPEEETEVEEEEAEEAQKPISTIAEKDDWIGCPIKDDWVTKADCDICRMTQFMAWSNCYSDRLKNPNSSLFQIKKPKPTEKSP